MPEAEALAHLGRIEWQAVAVAYLRGDVEAGSLWLQRRHADGTVESFGRLP